MTRKSIFVAFLFLIFSCTSDEKPQQINSLPVWYIAPKISDQNLYGVGEGYTLTESGKSALNNLAGKLMTSISSESSIVLESNKYSTNEQSRQKISETVAKITFSNYQISNSALFGGRIYVEISVNRDGFINDYTQKLKDLNQKMADLFKKAQAKDSGKSILERLSDLELVNNLSLEAQSISQILTSLSGNQNNFRGNLDLYNSYQSSYQNLASKIEFFIEGQNAPKPLVSKIINILNQKKLKVVKNKNLANSDLVIIQIGTKINEQKIYGSHIVKLKIDLNLLSNQNKIIKSITLEKSGSSVINKEEAVSASLSDLDDLNLLSDSI